MHNLQKLKVYHLARQNLRTIVKHTQYLRSIGDIKDQIERSSISVVSNIAEGAASSDGNFIRFLGYARASNKELHTQLQIIDDFGQLRNDEIIEHVDQVSAMLFVLIQHLQNR